MSVFDDKQINSLIDKLKKCRAENNVARRSRLRLEKKLKLSNKGRDELLKVINTWIDSEGTQGKGKVEYEKMVWKVLEIEAHQEKGEIK